MAESRLHFILVLAMFAAAAATALALFWIVAPYGRHRRAGWGPTLPARVGWILMESPAVLFYGAVYALGEQRFESVPLILLGLWQIHYVHRTFVFPFRLRGKDRRMPWAIVLMALGFNLLNAYVNARWISHLGAYDAGWLTDPRFVVGALVFFAGLAVNLRADSILLRLRKPGETEYKMPRGRLFETVTCPNYLGEIVEWTGWAIATWSLPGLAFAVYTLANLGPRALSHRRWYRETFPDYPLDRKALIPYVI